MRGEEAQDELRVTDKRRIYLDPEGEEHVNANEQAEQPNLKPSYVEELEARTQAAERQVQDVQARFDQLRQQLQRETDETRQRLNRSADERAATAKANFISNFLPVIDDLNRAIEAVSSGAPREAVLDGIRGIAARVQNALTNAGVEPIDSVGEVFDPELHEAVDTTSADAEMDGRVISEYSRGFRMGDRLLRPARVQVGRATETTDQPSNRQLAIDNRQ
ncbi:MAG TPA: nucleotide exchange factor GrpE [Pyrinomonadaceae bacterium]|nr:nucleotide exchange factor GrpE [Pyrinomonadaceae bacterium]